MNDEKWDCLNDPKIKKQLEEAQEKAGGAIELSKICSFIKLLKNSSHDCTQD